MFVRIRNVVEMKVYHKFILYQNKWLRPYIKGILNVLHWITLLSSIALFIALIFEKGFTVDVETLSFIQKVYKNL